MRKHNVQTAVLIIFIHTYRQMRLDPDREVDFKLIDDSCDSKAKLGLRANLYAEIT